MCVNFIFYVKPILINWYILYLRDYHIRLSLIVYIYLITYRQPSHFAKCRFMRNRWSGSAWIVSSTGENDFFRTPHVLCPGTFMYSRSKRKKNETPNIISSPNCRREMRDVPLDWMLYLLSKHECNFRNRSCLQVSSQT